MKNLNESKFVIVKIYEVNVKTLILFIRRVKSVRESEKFKIFKDSQINVVHQFIRSLLIHEIQFTHKVVYNVVLSLKQTQKYRARAFFQTLISRLMRTDQIA